MRYLLDTNTYIYLSTDREDLDSDVFSIMSEPDTLIVTKGTVLFGTFW